MKPNRATSRMRLEQMIETLRNQILQGILPAGTFLPSELELCELHQLSKNTVRKGLDVLVAEGLIEKLPRIGARIIQPHHQKEITIRFGCYESMFKENGMMEIVNQFNQSQSQIHVQTIPISYPKNQAGLELFFDNHNLDVMSFNIYDYDLLKQYGLDQSNLEPLQTNSSIYSFLNSPFKHGDRQYVLPFVFTPVILCYNKTHFQNNDIPEPDSGWTWTDLIEAANQLSSHYEGLGFYVHLPSNNRWPILLLQNDVKFERGKDGKYNLHDPKIIRSFEQYMDVVHEQLSFPNLSNNDVDAESLFLDQKTSMIMATYSSLNYFKYADFEYDIAPLPHQNDLRTMLIVLGMSINKNSKNTKAAQTFVDYSLSADAQMYIRKHTLSIPSMKSAAEWVGTEIINRPYRFHMYREIVHSFRYYEDLNLSAQQLYTMQQELRYYWSRISSLEEVLTRLEQTL